MAMERAQMGLLERLASGPVIGDGGFTNQLERRGYVEAGSWSSEAVIHYPDAVKQLHREYLRAGSDVMQTFTFFSSEDRLQELGIQVQCKTLNRAACDIARSVANEGGALVAGCLSPVPAYDEGKGKSSVMKEFQKQIDVFKEKGVDFVLGEFFGHVEEAEWAIETMKELNIPVACTMRLGPAGDFVKTRPQECAVRMAKAGADVIGVNCSFEPTICLETISMMKEGLDDAGISVYLMTQPVGWHTAEVRDNVLGYTVLPEMPFAMEPRLLTRMDMAKFARAAYNIGVMYIGGCCGCEPYHIRAIAEELAEERGRRPPVKDMHNGYDSLKKSPSILAKRNTREYWENLVPAGGRENLKLLADLVSSN